MVQAAGIYVLMLGPGCPWPSGYPKHPDERGRINPEAEDGRGHGAHVGSAQGLAGSQRGRLARELARDSELSMQDYDVLSALTDAAEHRWCARDLGAHLLWSPSRLSHHLDRMQRRELVRRVSCAEGRGSDVVLTAQGLAAIQAAAPGQVAAVRQAFIDRLTPKDLATFARASATIIDGLREPDQY